MMAVEACVNPKFMVDDSDDDVPLVFTRTKLNQISSELKNSSSLEPGKQAGNPGSDVRTSYNRSSSDVKGEIVRPPEKSSLKPSLGTQESPPPPSVPQKSPPSLLKPSRSPSPPPSRASPVKSPSINGASSMNEQKKEASTLQVKEGEQAPLPVKEENCCESEDSEDDRPLSARLSVGSKKGNSSRAYENGKPSSIDDEDSDDDRPLSARLSVGSKKGDSAMTVNVETPDDSDDEMPLSSRLRMKRRTETNTSKNDDSDDDKPLSSKLIKQNGSIKRENGSKKTLVTSAKRPPAESSSDKSSSKKAKLSDSTTSAKGKQVSVKVKAKDDDDDKVPIAKRTNKAGSGSKTVQKKKAAKVGSSKLKKVNKKSKKIMKKSKYSKELPDSSDGRKKWTTLVHNGVWFPPPYKPHGVKMLYDGKPVDLTPEEEEVATMYALMLDTNYVQMDKFNENFFNDWKRLLGKNHVIQDLKKCDFRPIYEWHLSEKERKKQMSKEEKAALSEQKLKEVEKYMCAIIDGVKEKVGNFKVEPPGLFRGRGDHPKTGMLKKRILPSDITINIGKDAPIPECPIPGQRWKEVRHDNTVTWLAYYKDPTNAKAFKYVFLAASSSLKGESDKEKYEKARELTKYIQGIRKVYKEGFNSKDMTKRQIAVATYLIDRLALRAGNEKDDDEADTVGCCTLKVENVKPIPPNILEFDFLGKDSIKYYKQFEADSDAYKAVEEFRKGKNGTDDLFDKLDTSKLNAHLKRLMPGLTAKVFRTFNASFTLDEMLARGAGSGEVQEKIAIYQNANKEVAIICNHQRTVSKSHSAQMERLATRINQAKAEVCELKKDLDLAKKGKPSSKDSNGKQKRNIAPEAIEKKIIRTEAKINKLERDMCNKEDLKEIALGTSKINYLDPRITVAWCKRNEVPIEKIFNKSLLAKFTWAMDVDPSFRFEKLEEDPAENL